MIKSQTGDFMFQVVPIIIGIGFIIVIVTILVAVLKGIARWNKNNSTPKLMVKAEAVAKRTEVHGGGNTSAYNYYFITFEVESGDRIELQVKDSDFGMLVEGDQGELQFQGTRYLGFKRLSSK
ncbi:hypothetical protein JOC77_001581 [Peribacillus deserti]|uniref:DUF2500 domain-containing protein n=1 Tax=Peribacillus deserti TaxID=673318 RepID=A0ABS2QG74_9BACI|nr:DUF2500 domain-containing protein [Peribacillus deserti]MBM7692154.1 hypothetical protein [Peribacillus deserti]